MLSLRQFARGTCRGAAGYAVRRTRRQRRQRLETLLCMMQAVMPSNRLAYERCLRESNKQVQPPEEVPCYSGFKMDRK